MSRRSILVGLLLVALVGCDDSSQSTRIPQATKAQLAAAGLDELPLAPAKKRVDLVTPEFSNPTQITNPLFPISRLRSTVLAGKVEGQDFKTETTLLPETRIIAWPQGQQTETLVSQYVAYLDGRIEEVALDFYAQADDGSVWYFGEDVFNYKEGFIADTAGTWIAGKDAPAAMIMPADPQVGDVYRPENVPGLVFEEVTIKAVDRTVNGPRGPVEGAMIARELHQHGAREDKTFAPGYGEFFTAAGGEVEAMALAIPTDKLSGPPPAELRTLLRGVNDVRTLIRAWKGVERRGVPPRLAARMTRAVSALARADDPRKARQAAIDVAQSALDLQLRHRPPAAIDRARFALWARQLQLDAAESDVSGVRGDVATLEWIRDRFAHTLDKVFLTRIDADLVELRVEVDDENLRGAAAVATKLQRASR